MKTTKDKVQELAEYLTENVRGSGIDAEWKFMHAPKDWIIIRNSYHVMNENGYYEGWQDFSVKLPVNGDVTNFKLLFHNTDYLGRKHQLRDYLEETISCVIDEWLENNPHCLVIKVHNKAGNSWEKYCLDPGIEIQRIWDGRPTNYDYLITSFEIKYPE